jgi:hypothetical protein
MKQKNKKVMKLRLTIVNEKASTIAFKFEGNSIEELKKEALKLAMEKKKVGPEAEPTSWAVMSDGHDDWKVGVELDEDSFADRKEGMRIMVEF